MRQSSTHGTLTRNRAFFALLASVLVGVACAQPITDETAAVPSEGGATSSAGSGGTGCVAGEGGEAGGGGERALADGADCASSTQCESGYCSSGSRACGVCGPNPHGDVGADCEAPIDCVLGLECVNGACAEAD